MVHRLSLNKLSPYLFLLPAISMLLFVVIYPLIYSLSISFQEYELARTSSQNRFVGLLNFQNMLYDQGFWNSLRNTLFFVSTVVSLEFFLGLALALFFNIEIGGRRAVRALMIMPVMVTPVVAGMIWRLIYNDRFGILNYFISLVNIRPQVWTGDPSLAMFSLILVDVWQWTPFMFLVLFAGLVALPRVPFEAAEIDGATKWKVFLYITLPMLKPTILVALLLRIIDAFKIFDVVYTLTYGGPGTVTETLSIFIFRIGLRFFHLGYAAALSWVFLIFIVITSQVFISYFRRTVRGRA